MQILIVGFCVFSGLIQVTQSRAPSNVAKAIDPLQQTIWSWTMLVAGILCVAGMVVKDVVWGPFSELAGMLGLGFGNLTYTVAIFVTAPAPLASYAGSIMSGFAIACFARAWMISRKIWQSRRGTDGALIEAVKEQISLAAEKEAREIISRDEWRDPPE